MKTKNSEEAAQKVSQALTQLLLQEPFFGALAMRLEYIADETIETECTNGKHVKYNPNFINTLTHEQIKSEMIHEVQHCAKLHPYRRDNRDLETYNDACDYVINNELVDANYKLDDTWLVDAKFKGLSEEQVYNELMKDRQNKPKGQGPQNSKGQGTGHGKVEDAQEQSNEGVAEQEQNWKQAVLQAAQQAKQYGNLPGFAQAMIDEIKNPAVDWRSALRKFLETTAKNDFTWSRPNRRYLALGLYLPSIRSEQLPPIVVYWDTSGSRWSSEQMQFAGNEISGIIMEAKPERTHVVYGDTQVCKVDVFEQGDVVKFDPKGGGGTSFEPIFKYIEENNIEPACFIGVTDLEGSFPDVAPGYPVIWVCDQKGATVPFGEVLEVKL